MPQDREALKRTINDVYWKDYPEPKLQSLYAYSNAHQNRISKIADFIISREKELLARIRKHLIHSPELLLTDKMLDEKIHILQTQRAKVRMEIAIIDEEVGK